MKGKIGRGKIRSDLTGCSKGCGFYSKGNRLLLESFIPRSEMILSKI